MPYTCTPGQQTAGKLQARFQLHRAALLAPRVTEPEITNRDLPNSHSDPGKLSLHFTAEVCKLDCLMLCCAGESHMGNPLQAFGSKLQPERSPQLQTGLSSAFRTTLFLLLLLLPTLRAAALLERGSPYAHHSPRHNRDVFR